MEINIGTCVNETPKVGMLNTTATEMSIQRIPLQWLHSSAFLASKDQAYFHDNIINQSV